MNGNKATQQRLSSRLSVKQALRHSESGYKATSDFDETEDASDEEVVELAQKLAADFDSMLDDIEGKARATGIPKYQP